MLLYFFHLHFFVPSVFIHVVKLKTWFGGCDGWPGERSLTPLRVSRVPVIPQHGVDSGPLGGNNGEDLKPAMYYERLKILRQRKGLENHTKVSTASRPH